MPKFEAQHLADWTQGRWEGRPPESLAGVGQDTRSLRPGELYVAIRGDRHDGHAFLAGAREAGAAAALVDEAFVAQASPDGADLPLLVVPDTRAGLTALAAGHLAGLDLTVVGVSGSVGKTTVKELTADMLERSAPTIRNPGNWNNDIGLPLALLRAEANHRYGVFELGINHPGEMSGLCACLRPHAAILTEIGPVHIEFFEDEEGIAREKSVLFAGLAPGAPAVVSRENTWFRVVASESAGRLVTTGESGADYCGSWVGDHHFVVREAATGETCRCVVPLPGEYFVEDALLAIALARQLGVSWESISAAVEDYSPPPMRWNRRIIAQRILIDDSYNANPVSMPAALAAFAGEPAPRHWLVLGGMLELGRHAESLHRELGAQVASGPWAGLVAFGPWGRYVADGAREAGMSEAQVHLVSTHDEVVSCLAEMTAPDEAILVKASRAEALDRIADAWERRLSLHRVGA